MSLTWSDVGNAIYGEDGYGTAAFKYINENQWAADALAAGAVAGGQYLLQKDQQKHERRQSQTEWDRKMSLNKAPTLNKDDYDWTDLTAGGLTDGGLISNAQKK